MSKTIQLNIPVRIEQVEKLAKVVAITTASRERDKENERITKSSIIRALIDVVDFESADFSDIKDEEELKKRITSVNNKEIEKIVETNKLDPKVLGDIYKKFAGDETKKLVAGDFINALYENGMINASSSEELWTKILEK